MNRRYVNLIFILTAVNTAVHAVNKSVETVKNFGISGKSPAANQFPAARPFAYFFEYEVVSLLK